MKLTKSKLKQIIQEELKATLSEATCEPPRIIVPATGKCEIKKIRCSRDGIVDNHTNKCVYDDVKPACKPPRIIVPATGKCERPREGCFDGKVVDPYTNRCRRAGHRADRYQKMARAAIRGSKRALRMLRTAARKSPDAQALLDAVYKEKPELKPSTPLSPEFGEPEFGDFLDENSKLTKSKLKQLIKEELSAVLSELEETGKFKVVDENDKAKSKCLTKDQAEAKRDELGSDNHKVIGCKPGEGPITQ